jgi:hypothetical protein
VQNVDLLRQVGPESGWISWLSQWIERAEFDEFTPINAEFGRTSLERWTGPDVRFELSKERAIRLRLP